MAREHRFVLEIDRSSQSGYEFSLSVVNLDRGGIEYPCARGSAAVPVDLLSALETKRDYYRALGQNQRWRSRSLVPYEVEQELSWGARCDRVREAAQTVRLAMNAWLEESALSWLYEEIISSGIARGEAVWLFLRSPETALWHLPWQAWSWFEARGFELEVALFPPGDFLQEPAAFVRPSRPRKARFLAVLSGDDLDLSPDHEALQNARHAEVHLLPEPARPDLGKYLWEENWDFFYFGGHSDSEGDTGKISLKGGDRPSLYDLRYSLGEAARRGGVQVALFNSCDGMGLLEDAFRLGIPAVVFMRDPIFDEVAPEFIKFFAQACDRGQTFYQAFAYARRRLADFEDRFPGSSDLPLLCQHPLWTAPTFGDYDYELPAEVDQPSEKSEKVAVAPIAPRRYGQLWGRAVRVGLAGAGAIVLAGAALKPLASQANVIGLTYHHKRNLDGAAHWYGLARLLDGSNGKYPYNLAWVEVDLQNEAAAAALFEQAANLGFVEAWAESAGAKIRQAWRLKNDPQARKEGLYRGLQVSEQCLESHTGNQSPYPKVRAACLARQGWALFELDRPLEAQAALEQAVRLAPDSPLSHCLLARLGDRRGDSDLARSHWLMVRKHAQRGIPEQDDCLSEAVRALSQP